MIKIKVVQRKDGLYIQNTDQPIIFKNGACFEITTSAEFLEKIPVFDDQIRKLGEGTELEFTLSGTEYIAKVQLDEPLVFHFQMGRDAKVETHIKCSVIDVKGINAPLFGTDTSFEPISVYSLHQAYGEVSRKYKPKAKHHNVNIFNCFKVLSTGILLSEYRKNINLFR